MSFNYHINMNPLKDLNQSINKMMAYNPNDPDEQIESHLINKNPTVNIRSPIKIVGNSNRQLIHPSTSFGNLNQSSIGLTRTVKYSHANQENKHQDDSGRHKNATTHIRSNKINITDYA
jgi:hypothetical protein